MAQCAMVESSRVIILAVMSKEATHFSRTPSSVPVIALIALTSALVVSACNTPTPTGSPLVTPTTTALPPAPTVPVPTTAPITAPDGLAVAFVADGTLWLWRAGVDPVPLTRADAFPSPQLSDDGQWIAFARESSAMIIAADGANEQAATVEGVVDQFVWRPGATELYLTSAGSAGTTVSRVDPASGIVIALGAFAADSAVTFAPDGAHLAIVAPDLLQLTDADGAPVGEPLEYPAVAVSDTQRWRPTPVWVDNATARLFTITETGVNAETIVWEVGVDKAAQEVARQGGAAFGGLLSPDGKQVLFVRDDQTLGLWDIATGESRQALDAVGASVVAWTPDSQAYVYTGIDPLQPFVIGVEPDAVARPAGTGPVLSLSWLADQWALYTSVAGGGEQLRLVEVGQTDGLIGISSSGAIGYDAVIVEAR